MKVYQVLFLCSFIALLLSIGMLVKARFEVVPIEGWYTRAYAAADAKQMEDWLRNLVNEMKKAGMTQGHYALIFKGPANDVAVDLQVFENLIDRCKAVENYPEGSMDYAESLEDIRRQMVKTGFDPYHWFLFNRYLPFFLLIIISPILLAISILWWLFSSEEEGGAVYVRGYGYNPER
jgi:hypothetical protein